MGMHVVGVHVVGDGVGVHVVGDGVGMHVVGVHLIG